MSCEKTTEIDLAAFFLEREEPRWQEFRNHYPGCEDCSREVAAWAKLSQLLEATQTADAHPPEEKLLGLTTLSLATGERAELEEHLAGCTACRNEVSVLRNFDFSAVVRAPVVVSSRPAFLQRTVQSLAEWRESRSWGSLQPALMAAAAILIALPIGFQLWQDREAPGLQSQGSVHLAQEESPAAADSLAGTADSGIADDFVEDSFQVAEVEEPSLPELEIAAHPAPEAPPVPEPAEVVEAAPVLEIAAAEPEAASPAVPSTEVPQKAGLVLEEGETLLIAALLPGDLPLYGVQGIMGLGGPSVRTGGFVRSVGKGGSSVASVEVLSPEHAGWTSQDAPTLYWRLSESTDLPVEIVISDDESLEPLLETRLTGQRSAGIHALSLADRGLALAPDTTYRWSVSLVVDDEHRSKDRFASSALLYRPPSAESASELAASAPGELAHRYAAQGYWYDAFDQLTLWLEAEPRDARLLEHRAALLEQVGLGSAEPTSE